MDNSSKMILTGIGSFILGSGIAGTGSFLVLKRYFKNKCDEDMKNLTEYYISKYENFKEGKDDGSSEKESNEEEHESKAQLSKEDISNLYRSSEPKEMDKTAYGKYFSSDSTSDNSSTKPAKKKVVRKNGPKMVDSTEWDANPNNYEKKFLVYYEADDTMIDEETEKILDNGEELVGPDNLSQADQFDDVIFVSNAKTKTIYQVTVEQAAFSEIGIND